MFFSFFDLFFVLAKSSCAETEIIVLKLCSFSANFNHVVFLGLTFLADSKKNWL